MVLCSWFKWGTAKGGFNLPNVATDSEPERRGTIIKIEVDPNPATANEHINNGPSQSGLSVDTGIASKKSSNMSIQSVISYGRDSDSEPNDRKSSAGRKTVSDLIQGSQNKTKNVRKRGVIAPHAPLDTNRSLSDLQYEKFAKDEKSAEQIKKAIMSNDFLKNLMDQDRLAAVVEATNPVEYPAGSLIIREGESGSHLFVSAYGQFEVLKGGHVVKTFGPGEAFGELAILYKAKRFASIRCITEAKVWTLQRRVFQKIMVRSGQQEQEDNIRFLASVPLLQGIHHIELTKISDFLKREFFSAGTAVVRQGDRGDKFYIIRGGTVIVTKREGDAGDKPVGVLKRGEYFGEQALLHEDRRLATVTAQPPGVECLTLERGHFTELLGNLEELKKVRHAVPRPSQQRDFSVITQNTEYSYVELKDLEIIGTMGVGGFGRVELVQYRQNKNLTFALKCLKKIDMVQQQQQEHAYNEKNIMMMCKSDFICKLYRTFKDNKYIYFLMEPVLGGDVWTILQKQRFFPENVARFMTACVLEAFQFLHSKDIIYRDLKPENLMLDDKGYIKLVDFGFAKRLTPNSKTWTFAGTPEYVAPEIVLNKGHDRAVDCWALGVLIHELLAGKPPFRAAGGDHMKTYTLILRGIDAVTFHPRVPESAKILVRKLCRPVPSERLGYLKNGIADIKNHKLYRTFKDNKYIYFLMEPVLGGDVWTILQKQRFFPENVARFMTACVLEAFQFLHSKDIIYRDLKPENLMLDDKGYIKLVDFGFAKRLTPNSKTWTFAGTPEYVAPEIVLNKGHDRAVDCWALGVLIHELLAGKPPFRAAGGDHMKTYTLILRGIDAVTFHPRVPESAKILVRKLCRPVPSERLGYLKNGIADIKNHKWFLGFDWDGLRSKRLKAPLIQPVGSNLDLSNFEKYPKDKLPPDETSGWDWEF